MPPERNLGRNLIGPSIEIDLMGDFLEMERIAAIPPTYGRSNPSARVDDGENPLRDELEAMINRTTELEENLKKVTTEKLSMEIALNECQTQLKASQDQLKQTEVWLVELKTQLAVANEAKRDVEKEVAFTKVKLKESTKLLDEAEENMVQIQDQLIEANEAKNRVEVQLGNANLNKAKAESQLKVMEVELKNLRSRIFTLEKEVEKEKSFSRKLLLSVRYWKDKELAVAATKFAECQKTIASLDRQLKSLATLDDFLIDTEIDL
ncbi:hypothetical protein DH2020_012597 [Rehmannia glutinosa]|uniref:Uncharacterized protein n=1 Tax=Rehmannia glutinosa TaxID=99300 RepID=A0ABR0X136_REHGL